MDSSQGSRPAEIYVGYRPVPLRFRRAVRLSVGLLLVFGVGVGVLAVHALRPAGTGVWDTGSTVTIEGSLRLLPYPHLDTPEGSILLVEPGKFGSQARFEGHEGASISVEGTTIARGPWRMLEVVRHESNSEPLSLEMDNAGEAQSVVATGEILDGKCYLGAMKPGDGPTHKTCAMLCLRGGIPALFVGRTAEGQWINAVVTSTDGGPIHESLIGFVGDPVTIRGKLGMHGSLPALSLAPGDVMLNR